MQFVFCFYHEKLLLRQFYLSVHMIRECNPGTRVPENPGNPPVFKPVNLGLCAGINPGLTGLISGVSQYSVHCAEKRAETEST